MSCKVASRKIMNSFVGHPPPYFVFKSMTQPTAVLATGGLPLRQVNWGSISNVSEEASKAMEYVQSKSKPVEVITGGCGLDREGIGKIHVVRGIFPSHPTNILWMVYLKYRYLVPYFHQLKIPSPKKHRTSSPRRSCPFRPCVTR